ncbi:MAG: hypothetical protein II677_05550 [Muribaculaceae bacterium]|nr:hypothetical protein [Muribaculaceae bacterium]
MKINFKHSRWSFSIILTLATLGATLLTSCDEDNGLPYYDDKSLDVPYLFTEGYQDEIQYPYQLSTPLTDWLSLVRDDVKVCKLSIPGTHDSMTGMGFYTPIVKYVSNIMAISQVSTFSEQMSNGIRFFDFRPVVAIDTLAKNPEDRQIMRLAHGFTEVNVSLEESIDWMQEFLKSHPTEFFIVKIQADNGMESQQNWVILLNKVLSKAKYDGLFVKSWHPGITVGEMRGKILWLSRYDLRPVNTSFHYPVAYCDWPDEDPDVDEELHPDRQRSCAIYNMEDPSIKATLYKQDYYKTTNEKRMANKISTVLDMMKSAREATASDEDIWIVNHCSAYTEVSARGYITNASNLHPKVIENLLANEGTVGIMPMDMACHDYVHCIINGGTPYTSDYLYGFYPLSQSLTNLLVMSNKKFFK